MGQGPAECIERIRFEQCSLNRAITIRYGFHDHRRPRQRQQPQHQLQYVCWQTNGHLKSSCPSLAIFRTKYTSFGCNLFILHLICKYSLFYDFTLYSTISSFELRFCSFFGSSFILSLYDIVFSFPPSLKESYFHGFSLSKIERTQITVDTNLSLCYV